MRRASALFAAAALVAVVGCGDGRLDSGELHDRVKGACDKDQKSLEKIPDPTDDRTTKVFISQAALATTTLYRELAGLKPPKDAQQGYAFAVGLVRQQANLLKDASSKLASGGDEVVVLRNVADQTTQIHSREQTAWEIVGVPSCASR